MNPTWWTRLRGSLFGRRRIDAELREEIQSHLQLEIEDAMSSGQSAASARRRFGNRTLMQEDASRLWSLPALETWVQDLRYGVRLVRRDRAFSAVAVLSLAIGIGANTAIFSVIDALVLRRLPVSAPDQLVLFRRIETNGVLYNFSYRWFERLREQPAVFADVSASWLIDRYNVHASGAPGDDAEKVAVMLASGNYFSNLGVATIVGRALSASDDQAPRGNPVAIISQGFWRRRFALASDVVGRTLTIHGTAFTIVGVTPREFTGEWVGNRADVWVPFAMASQVMPETPGGPAQFPVVILGRRNPGVSIQQAQAASRVVWQQIVYGGTGTTPAAQPLQSLASHRLELESGATGYSERRPALANLLTILMSAAGTVLLAVCANVANLLLARSGSRQREMAIRLAIGAGGLRLRRQLLIEGAVLAILAGALGLLLAVGATRMLTAMLAAGVATVAPLVIDAEANLRVFAFTTTVSGLTVLLFALWPTLQAPSLPLSSALTGRGASGSARLRLGKALVIAQLALTVVLVSMAALFARTLHSLQAQDIGFNRDHLLLVWTAPVQTGRTGEALAALLDIVQQRISAVPGVLSASVSNGGVLEGGADGGGPSDETAFEGLPPKPGLVLRYFAVAPRYFETTGLRLVGGRPFTERDTDTSPLVAIASQTMAHFFFGSENPIGKWFGGPQGTRMQIVGVVKDARAGTARDHRGVWYVPYRQDLRVLQRPWCLVVRTAVPPANLASRIRDELRGIDANLPVLRINTIDDQLSDVLSEDRMTAAFSIFFGTIAVVVADVGLYGLMSYSIARRTNEIGVRMAMGATPSAILRMVLSESLVLVAVGLAVGIPVVLVTTRLVSARLFGVSPADPITIGAASLLVIVVSLSAALIPARRSSRVPPVVALR